VDGLSYGEVDPAIVTGHAFVPLVADDESVI
jgi:hypothetical protein